jgi:hypothetical protein
LDGIKATVGGWQVRYLPAAEIVVPSEYVENFDVLEDRRLAGHPRMRRFLARFLPDFPITYYLLHWSDGSDLTVLDEKIRQERAGDADFANALVGELRSLVCRTCEAIVRAVVADTGNPLFAQDRPRRLAEHAFVTSCPVCGTALGEYVMELVE